MSASLHLYPRRTFLAKVNVSERELTFTFAICNRPSVCLSVIVVHPTRQVEIFGNISTPFLPWPFVVIYGKFYGDCPRGTPPSGV